MKEITIGHIFVKLLNVIIGIIFDYKILIEIQVY